MKLQGSKTAKIQCIECGEVSNSFRVWLYEEEGESLFDFPESNLPQGWQMEDETELDDGLVAGYCPAHIEK